MRRKNSKIRVGITMGDPSGIGPAIAVKAVHALKGLADFVLIGDAGIFSRVTGPAGRGVGLEFVDVHNVDTKAFQFGKIKAEYGRASIEYLDKALDLIKSKKIDCLVTCPISKEAIHLAGYRYSGHTEYFARRTHVRNFVMMLLNRELKISLVTRHIPLRKVPLSLDKDTLRATILLTYDALKKLFSIKKPRMVICGLNPHASDNGLIGNEEQRIIAPVLQKLKSRIECIDGPLSADVAIAKTRQGQYDCAVAMYHDQALIPLKLSGGESGVNITLGLDFIRTSPLHGTAFDIAGKPALADPASLIEAITRAVECTSNLKKD
jgi:4-hydroxythreonine-4-phosphate dehydrogenase